MKQIFLSITVLLLSISALAQENPRDSLKFHKKSPDTDTAKPALKHPPEIDSINRTDTIYKRKRTNKLGPYKEDSIPKKNKSEK